MTRKTARRISERISSAAAKLKAGFANTGSGGAADYIECQNCGASLQGEFCHVCGQRGDEPRRAVIGLVQDFFVDTLAIDGKLARTLGLLLWKPGRLASYYLEGKRVRYSPPFRLYLFTSVFFFIAAFWALDFSDFKIDDKTLQEDLTDETLAEIEADSPEAAKALRALKEARAKAADDAGGAPGADGAAPAEEGREGEDKGFTFGDPWSEANFNGPEWLEPYAKQFYEAAARAAEDPRLFISEARQNLPRTLLLAPVVYALVLFLLYFYRRKFYVYDHFVVSLYMHAALYAYLLAAILISRAPVAGWLWFAPLVWGWLQPFLIFRQAYGSNWFSAWIKWLISILIYLAAVTAIITFGLTYSLYKS